MKPAYAIGSYLGTQGLPPQVSLTVLRDLSPVQTNPDGAFHAHDMQQSDWLLVRVARRLFLVREQAHDLRKLSPVQRDPNGAFSCPTISPAGPVPTLLESLCHDARIILP